MSTSVVVDASVALKWVVTEPGTDEAFALLNSMADSAGTIVAPEHLIGDVGNALRRRVAQGVLSADDAAVALDNLAELDLEFDGGSELWFRSLSAALDWGVTTYEALYVLLALNRRTDLVTADLRLVDAARRNSLPVRPLIPRGPPSSP